MRKDVEAIKEATGEYWRYALEARREYLRLLSLSDKKITAIYHEHLRRILEEYRSGRNKGLVYLLGAIDKDSPSFHGDLAARIENAIESGSAAGIRFGSLVTMDCLEKAGMDKTPMIKAFEWQRKQAVAACYARTHKKGLYVSDRIWNTKEETREAMKNIVQAGIGEDAAKVARALEIYVKQGKTAFCLQFPNMMKRMGSRIPQNLDYNALRLARTELSAAYGAATIRAAQASPAIGKVKWVLSASHPKPDICDTYANGGDGQGVYDVNKCPPYPAHPNCLCTLQPAPDSLDDFMKKIQEWRKDPSSQPDIEAWHNKHYGRFAKREKQLPHDDKAAIAESATRAKVDILKREIERQEKAQQQSWTVERDNNLNDLYKQLTATKIDAGKRGIILTSELEKSYSTAEIEAIRAKVKAAPQDFRVVWNRFEDKMKVLDAHYKGVPHYSRLSEGIRLDAHKDQTDKDQKPFKTIFHELGHLVDHFAGRNVYHGSHRYSGGVFVDMIKSEASDYILKTLSQLRQKAVANGTSLKYVRKQNAYNKISDEIRKMGNTPNIREVSDIWDGATKKKVNGDWGHRASYWKDEGQLPTEAFAHMFEATINNPEAVENIKYFFPKSYELFMQMIKEIAEGGRL